MRWGGIPGRIARENAERNPSRTAVTAAALMIGIVLVSFVAVFAAGLKKRISDVLSTDLKAQLFASTRSAAAATRRSSRGSSSRSPPCRASPPSLRPASCRRRWCRPGADIPVSSAAPAFADAYRLRWVAARDDVVRNLTPAQGIVEEHRRRSTASRSARASRLRAERHKGTFKIAGIVEKSNPSSGL